MEITCISDLHGHYPELEGGDLLIVAGDLTATDTPKELDDFCEWMCSQDYKEKIIIPGNHDDGLHTMITLPGMEEDLAEFFWHGKILCDSGAEFEGLKIWGSPWTLRHKGMKENERAFTVDTEEELAEKWAMIPDDVDILVTHSPPYGILDEIKNYYTGKIESKGSPSLWKRIVQIDGIGNGKNRLLVCGHIHEAHGIIKVRNFFHDKITWRIINASHVNENYEPVNRPVRVVL